MAWMTPFEAVTFAVTTRAPPTKTLPPRTRIASRWPFSVFTARRFVTLAAVSLPSTTCSSSTERSFALSLPSRASVAFGTLAKAASVGAKTV